MQSDKLGIMVSRPLDYIESIFDVIIKKLEYSYEGRNNHHYYDIRNVITKIKLDIKSNILRCRHSVAERYSDVIKSNDLIMLEYEMMNRYSISILELPVQYINVLVITHGIFPIEILAKDDHIEFMTEGNLVISVPIEPFKFVYRVSMPQT